MNDIWLAIDKYGRETISSDKPSFDGVEWEDYQQYEEDYASPYHIALPKGSIKRLLGRELTFEESPILVENLE